jgi:hypothetical protein
MASGSVVAVGVYIIAQGNGPAEGHPALSAAFRAEAYGLLSAAQFINQMIAKFQLTIDLYRWFFRINNKALIDRMQVHGTNTITARSTQWPDADITMPAHRHLKHLNAQYLHVKSHQDNTKRKQT